VLFLRRSGFRRSLSLGFAQLFPGAEPFCPVGKGPLLIVCWEDTFSFCKTFFVKFYMPSFHRWNFLTGRQFIAVRSRISVLPLVKHLFLVVGYSSYCPGGLLIGPLVLGWRRGSSSLTPQLPDRFISRLVFSLFGRAGLFIPQPAP